MCVWKRLDSSILAVLQNNMSLKQSKLLPFAAPQNNVTCGSSWHGRTKSASIIAGQVH
jgi:hypothetical protein